MSTPETDFSAWVGKRQTISDIISPVQVRQMAATLDDAQRMAQPDCAVLPAGWHWLYFNPLEQQAKLGSVGHPLRGDFLPPVALERRMWAGSRLRWQRPFEVGMAVEKRSEILKISHKSGRSGDMVFVTLAHRYHDSLGLLLEEEHDIVYRDKAGEAELAALRHTGARIRAGEHAFERRGEHLQAVHADAVMLYRYSAATFNGHRIHYDADYCREVEGYPGLVVHGPLIATLLLNLMEQQVAPGRAIATFEFRAMQPTFELCGFHLHAAHESAQVWRVWSTNNLGQVGLDGRISLA